jgi:pimeloyl-ACP methyl ester carboxylesterase
METIPEAAGHETRVEGVRIAWGELGAGPPLVLLHGVWDSHRTWRRAAPLLARDFHVFMPDLAGHGWSERPDAPYTLAWHARLIAAWMESLGLERAHVCGHSYGGGVALWMLLQERSRIDRLALVAPGGLGRGVSVWMRLGTFPLLGPAFTPLVMRLGLPALLRAFPAIFGDIEPDEVARVAQMNRVPGTARAFRRTLGGVVGVFGQYMSLTAARAPKVSALPPIALFWGTKDPVIPLRHGERLSRQMTGVTLSTYRGCGHYPHLEAAPQFSRDLQGFLCDPSRPCAAFSSERSSSRSAPHSRFVHPSPGGA